MNDCNFRIETIAAGWALGSTFLLILGRERPTRQSSTTLASLGRPQWSLSTDLERSSHTGPATMLLFVITMICMPHILYAKTDRCLVWRVDCQVNHAADISHITAVCIRRCFKSLPEDSGWFGACLPACVRVRVRQHKPLSLCLIRVSRRFPIHQVTALKCVVPAMPSVHH